MTKVLGFDTSDAHCGAALFADGDVIAAAYEDMTRGQAERLFPMLEEVLNQGGLTWADLDAIGTGTGPGNFTGIRISVSAARGLALSLGIPAVGVSLFDALAEEAELPALLPLHAPRDALYTQLRTPDQTGDIAIATLDALPACPPGTRAIGARSDDVASQTGLARTPAKYAPASAIARIAARRFATETERPTPLYIRPADAAPPSAAPVKILP